MKNTYKKSIRTANRDSRDMGKYNQKSTQETQENCKESSRQGPYWNFTEAVGPNVVEV